MHEVYKKMKLEGGYGEHGFTEYQDGELKREIPVRFHYSEKLYEALWRIEKQAGNPRIRFEHFNAFEFASLEEKPPLFSLKIPEGVPHYDCLTNTIYIFRPNPEYVELDEALPWSDESVISDFVGESAHGKQFGEKPFSTDLRGIRDIASVLVKSLRTMRSPQVVYFNTLYKKPGTVEYEAHQQIEPELKKELDAYETEEENERLKEYKKLYRGH